MYAEDGSLLGEYPMEANPATAPTKGAQHIWLPTANGPMPIAVVGEGRQYAVHADHLNTPRRLTQEDGKVAWQWAYSAFGDEAPTTAATRFTSATTNPTTGSTAVPLVQYNLRYPG
ncbi:RHS domain-containing protein, partial [Phenylobacterium sp. LjRoot164]|uniref:RHS domain-containing protein n=2 Tax=Pseudomonadota TaxID=1224 RepID=UPI003F50A73B